ncbi:hypothetical protein T484DRAFT_3117617 [Baffinella frigidus]|nr:hypothetical protein T484DRAFT_3117617 [Cryptophyta sp. CCMP2293]
MCGHEAGAGDVIWGWAPGELALSFPAVAGVPLLGTTGYRSIQLQTHFDNPSLKSGRVDNSGIRIFYTSKKRQHEVGVLSLGDAVLRLLDTPLPKGDSLHRFHCAASFTNQFKAEEVNVFSRVLHMHKTGQHMETRQYRDGALLRRDQADWFDFNMNGGQVPKTTGEGFKIRRGDSFETDCYYRTSKLGKEVKPTLQIPAACRLFDSVSRPNRAGFAPGARPCEQVT